MATPDTDLEQAAARAVDEAKQEARAAAAAAKTERDASELQLLALEEALEKEVADAAEQPHAVVLAEDGTEIDMRPPLFKLKAVENEYSTMLQGQAYADAVRLLVVRLALTKIVFGEQHTRVARAHLTLAQGYRQLRGLNEQSIQHAKIALNMAKRMTKRGEHEVDEHAYNLMLVDIYHELGDARLALGRLDEAKKSLVKAEKIFDSVPADRHKVEKEIALARSMGQLCQAIDRPSLAVDFFRKATELADEYLDDEGEDMILMYRELALAHQSTNNSALATVNMKKSLNVAKKVYGEKSAAVGECLVALARVEIEQADEDAAEANLCEALDIFVLERGADDASTIQVQDELARLLVRTERNKDAVRLLKRMVLIKKRVYGEQSSEYADTQELLGGVRLTQGKVEEALTHIKAAHKGYSTTLGKRHKTTMKTQAIIESLEGPVEEGDARPSFVATVRNTSRHELMLEASRPSPPSRSSSKTSSRPGSRGSAAASGLGATRRTRPGSASGSSSLQRTRR